MKDKLLWSWSSVEDGVRSRHIALPGWMQGLISIVIMALLLFLILRFLVPLFSPWILIPLVFIVPNFVMVKLFRSKLQEQFERQEWYLRIYNDGIDLKTPHAHGFYSSDNIDMDSLQVDSLTLLSFDRNRMGPVMKFDVRSPGMTVEVPLAMPPRILRDLKEFIDSLKQANS